MYCPACGQQQMSNDTRFCSRCGFLLSGVADVLSNGGVVPGMSQAQSGRSSPRKRGLMQGLFIFLLSFLIVPIIAVLTIAVRAEPFAVAIAAVLLTVGGILRALYALMFESPVAAHSLAEKQFVSAPQPSALGQAGVAGTLPPQQSIPVSAYRSPASWRDTNDLAKSGPGSVTEGTTKLLQDEDPQ